MSTKKKRDLITLKVEKKTNSEKPYSQSPRANGEERTLTTQNTPRPGLGMSQRDREKATSAKEKKKSRKKKKPSSYLREEA